jgi:hypothetical protein
MSDAYVNGKRYRLNPDKPLGQGGEAYVFDLGDGRVLKIYRRPDDVMFKDEPIQQAGARHRLTELQRKLPAFPKGLPPKVIAPQELATSAGGEIIGYTMRFLAKTEPLFLYGKRDFRQNVSADTVREVLRDLHGTVKAVHEAQAVIGDFNDLNVLVAGNDAYIIDADSMQFGPFRCVVFTARFVDPLLCDPTMSSPEMARGKTHSPDSDWYAYSVMAMQSLLCVGPYGGVFMPKDKRREVKHDARPLKRITVFNPEVRYPKSSIPFKVLPDDLLEHFHRVFEKDQRGVFPIALLDGLRWTKCSACGTEHARSACPDCALAAPAAIKETIQIRGQVTATRIFRTHGQILRVEVQGNKIIWLYHEGNEFRREDGRTVVAGALDPNMTVRLRGSTTYLAKGDKVIGLKTDGTSERIDVDIADNAPVFASNASHAYWTDGDRLLRDGAYAPERIGDVISGLTHVWAGPSFGFGFYRASQLTVAFVFDKDTGTLNDSVKLPPIRGQLVDAACAFSKERAWFFTTTQEGADLVNRCVVITGKGIIEASAKAIYGDGSWLGQIRGGAPAGNFLLMPTDDGVVKVEIDGDSLVVAKSFPDTEPFVGAGTRLYIGPDGLYATTAKEIVKLVIK